MILGKAEESALGDEGSSAAELLGPTGPFASAMSGYEARPGQLEMACAVERTLTEERILMVEAGTGTGKSLAYLVPALLSGKKVVISTATRALQEQIAHSDIPLIGRVLGFEPQVAVMKGLSNYLCRRRLDAFRGSTEALRPSYSRSLDLVNRWAEETETGDIGELVSLSEDDPLLPLITASSEARVGAPCPHHERCFVTRMKRDAEQARVVIVNHHLFFADLALRGNHPGRVLPDYNAVIFDEAHQLEDVATQFFGTRVSKARFEDLSGDLERTLSWAEQTDPLLTSGGGLRVVRELRDASTGFWEELRRQVASDEPKVILERDIWTGPLAEAWHRVDSALEAVAAVTQTTSTRVMASPSRPRDAAAVADAMDVSTRRASQLREQLATVVDGARGLVSWAELEQRRTALGASPVDVSQIFRSRVFESIPAVVLTSATLTSAKTHSGGDPSPTFEYLRSRLGAEGDALDITELVVPSPFDFRENALLYMPRDLPAPNHPDFPAALVARTVELVEMSNGGAFVLTTSLRTLRVLDAQLRARLPHRRILTQGQAPKASLLAAFRQEGSAVLVATMGFWEGVDVPGQALRLVVLEKIPFAVPSDPIVRARTAALEAEGKNPFMEFHVPAAAILLKQGFGRLIRTRLDRGVVALLDTRVTLKGYGQRLLSSLPPARRTTNLEQVRAFWSHATPGEASAPIRRPTSKEQ